MYYVTNEPPPPARCPPSEDSPRVPCSDATVTVVGDYNMQMETTPKGPNPCWGWGGAAAATRDYRVSGY